MAPSRGRPIGWSRSGGRGPPGPGAHGRPSRADAAYFGWIGLLGAFSVASGVVGVDVVQFGADVARSLPHSGGQVWVLVGPYAAWCLGGVASPVVFARRARADRRAGRTGDIGDRALRFVLAHLPTALPILPMLLGL